jgi:hypothetical protein
MSTRSSSDNAREEGERLLKTAMNVLLVTIDRTMIQSVKYYKSASK